MSDEAAKHIVGALGLLFILALPFYLFEPQGGWRAWWARRPKWRDYHR
jgi:hypothetical protein